MEPYNLYDRGIETPFRPEARKSSCRIFCLAVVTSPAIHTARINLQAFGIVRMDFIPFFLNSVKSLGLWDKDELACVKNMQMNEMSKPYFQLLFVISGTSFAKMEQLNH